MALASLAQWVDHQLEDRRVQGLIPVKGTCLISRLQDPLWPGPWPVPVQEATNQCVSLTSVLLCLSLSLKNQWKNIHGEDLKKKIDV